MTESRSTFSRILTWTILGILALFAIKIAFRLLGFLMGVVGMVFGVLTFVLFTVGPIVLVGWLAAKAWKAFSQPKTAA